MFLTCCKFNVDEVLCWIIGSKSMCDSDQVIISLMHRSDHTLPVTSLHCGFGGINGILVSSSLDYSCKIRQVSSGVLLRSIKFPACVLCSTTDQGDHHLYAGGKNGVIFAVSLVGSTGWAKLIDNLKWLLFWSLKDSNQNCHLIPISNGSLPHVSILQSFFRQLSKFPIFVTEANVGQIELKLLVRGMLYKESDKQFL